VTLVGEVCAGIGTCPTTSSRSEEEEVEEVGERTGLIVLSDPWDIRAWEVMPRFSRKRRRMLLASCNNLHAGSNR